VTGAAAEPPSGSFLDQPLRERLTRVAALLAALD
jgi:hypothetical protein